MLLFLTSVSMAHSVQDIPNGSKFVSLLQVIANPEKYHGQKVRMIAYAVIKFEGDGLWFTKDHYSKSLYPSCVWIDFANNTTGLSRKQLEKINKSYVHISGTIDKNNKGHMGLYVATLSQITKLVKKQPDPTLP